MAKPLTEYERYQKVLVGLVAVIAIILTGWALKGTYLVTMPLALAFFVAVILHPLQDWLNRQLPDRLRFLSLLLTMLCLLAVLLLLAYAGWYAVGLAMEKAPGYTEAAQEVLARLQAWAARQEFPLEQALPPLGALLSRTIGLLTTGFTDLWLFALMLILFFFLVLLMLLEAEEWRTKLKEGMGPARAATVLSTMGSIEEKVRKFLLIKTLISALSGTAAGLWLWLLGVDFALLWAVLIFLLNYIPNVGSIIGIFPPSITALLQFGPGAALLAIIGLTAIEQVLGNFVDPRLEGRTLSISPIVVLVSIVFWGWVWGIIGALIGVLLTATLIIICDHIPVLRPVAFMLSRPTEGEIPGGEAPEEETPEGGDEADSGGSAPPP